MSTPVESTFTFYGNEKIRELEKEIIKRFKEDYDKNTSKNSGIYNKNQDLERYSAITRILYGMSKKDEFDGWDLLGAYGCWYFGSTDKFEIESKDVPPEKLQDHIAMCASILDPNVIVQMDYKDNVPYMIGTRIVFVDKTAGLLEHKEQTRLEYQISCDEDDIDDALEDNPELDRWDVMSFQEIDQQIVDIRQEAIREFNSNFGKNIVFVEVD